MKRFDAVALWSLPRVGSPELSPDGETVAVPVTIHDPVASRVSANLHILPRGGGPSLRLTTTTGRDSSPAWSPDGSRLAFVRKPEGEGKAQLHVIAVGGGEAVQVTDLPVAVASPRWHPDGDRVLFTCEVPPQAGSWDEVKEILAERKDRSVSARVTENRIVRFWSRWLTSGDYPHLFSVSTTGREVVDLTPGMRRHFNLMEVSCDYDIAPDGSALLFHALSTEAPFEGPEIRSGIFSLVLDSGGAVGEPVELTKGMPGSFNQPRYSPDGSRFAYGWREDPRFYADHVKLGVWPLEGTGVPQLLTADWDRSVGAWTWNRAGDTLHLVAEDGHRTSIFDVSAEHPLAPGTSPQRVVAGGTAGGVQAAPDDGIVFQLHDISHPPEVASLPAGASEPVLLTSLACEPLADFVLGDVSEETFTGAGGAEIGMIVVRPPGATGGEPLPLVHMVHGGPHSRFADTWHWRWNPHVFAAPGYLCALVNFHGSTGCGAEFTRSILGEHPRKPFADVMAATDVLIESGRVDPDRMAVTGGSYGGYLVSWIGAHTDRFRCIVNHAGVVDLMAQMGSDVTHGRLLAYGGEPWKDQELIERHSPVRFSRGMNTPMLVLHGELDYRVPVGNGLEIYGILKAKGVPARLVYYPDEHHWILKPGNSIHWYGEVASWLERWLGPASPSSDRDARAE